MKYLTMNVKPQLINHTSELYPHIHNVHQNEPWVTGILSYITISPFRGPTPPQRPLYCMGFIIKEQSINQSINQAHNLSLFVMYYELYCNRLAVNRIVIFND